MVGQLALDQHIGVRLPVSQPRFFGPYLAPHVVAERCWPANRRRPSDDAASQAARASRVTSFAARRDLRVPTRLYC